jgi:hypothetical protein
LTDEHTGLEERLRKAAATGGLVDLTDGEDQDVPAELLVDLLIRPLRANEIRRRSARPARSGCSAPASETC